MAEPLDPSKVGYEECLDDGSSEGSGSGSGSGDLVTAFGETGNLCDLDITNNVWVEGVVDPPANKRGICMLNTMSRAQIIYVLQHDPKAREDLAKVTSNPDLLKLLDEVKLLSSQNFSDVQQSKNVRSGLPYYNVFAGKPPVPRK